MKKNEKSLTMQKKVKGGIHSVGKNQKIEGGTLWWEFFFQRNTLREYLLAPLSFLDDVKILLRKLSKNCKNCKIVRIVRKVGHSG